MILNGKLTPNKDHYLSSWAVVYCVILIEVANIWAAVQMLEACQSQRLKLSVSLQWLKYDDKWTQWLCAKSQIAFLFFIILVFLSDFVGLWGQTLSNDWYVNMTIR